MAEEDFIDPIENWVQNATDADVALQTLNAQLTRASNLLYNDPSNKLLQKQVDDLQGQVMNAMQTMQTNVLNRMGYSLPDYTGGTGGTAGMVSGQAVDTSGMVSLGGGLYVDPDTGRTVRTTGGGYFGSPTGTATSSVRGSSGKTSGSVSGLGTLTGGTTSTGDSLSAYVDYMKQTAAAQAEKQKVEARAGLQAWLNTFFDPVRDADTISSLMGFVNQQITDDVPVEAIMLNVRQQPFYKERFKGNEGLRAAGLSEMSPAEYLAAERQYGEILTSANLSALGRRDIFASLIGGQVSAVELQDRVVNVYDRIKNADTDLRNEMQRLNQLGNLTAADFAEALLTGKEGAASLKRKIANAEISTEFTVRGLTSALGSQELANLGVSREQARQGAEYTKTGTERLTTLADIYNQQAAGIQGELETEAFKGLASQRRKRLVGSEQASFAGRSGTAAPSLGSSTIGNI